MDLFIQILEVLYFISSIGLFIAVIIGLKQLKVTKDIAKMNAKRDSLKLATSQIHYYLTEIVKLQNILDAEIKKQNINLFKNAEIFIDGKSIRVKLNSSKEEIMKLKTIIEPLLNVCNSMECFAAFFTSKLADEQIAYKAVGKTYRDSVMHIMPELVAHAREGHHINILELFFIWYDRNERNKLQYKKDNSEKNYNK